MRKQVWYFKFGTCILGPIVTRAKWAGKEYHPEDLPDYVYDALGMSGHIKGRRAILYPTLFRDHACEKFREQWPKHWRWNRVEILPG